MKLAAAEAAAKALKDENERLEAEAGVQTSAVAELCSKVDELERELGISNIIKLASNENPLGPSPKALQAMQQS